MAALEWIAAGLCFGLLGWLSSWLLLDRWRERRQTRAAANLAAVYSTHTDDIAASDEETWPIVAQQPQREYPNAVTLRIPRQTGDGAGVAPRARPGRHAAYTADGGGDACTMPLTLTWPTEDVDKVGGLVQWYADLDGAAGDLPTGVLPVIRDDMPDPRNR